MVAAGVMEGWTSSTAATCGRRSLRQGRRRPRPVHGRGGLLQLTISGRGGHAGLPHTAVDTIACAAELVGSLQHIVSRRLDPLAPAVVTVGSLHAGDAPNVIPGEAVLTGTTRSFDPGVRALIPS